LPHVSYRIASSAFVNAELVRVTAPIAGHLTRNLPRKGDFIEKNKAVTLIESLSRDQRHLLHLSSQHAVANERATLVRKQLSEIAAADTDLAERVKTYREGMIARLQHERDETAAEKIGCLAEVAERREIGSRMEQLVKTGLATAVRTAEAMASFHANSTRCEMAAAKLERLEGELKSAQHGVFLRDGANDASYSQQQRDRLFLRRQELEIKVMEESLQASQIAAELNEERKRVDRLSRFDTTLPAQHVVWSVAASPGSTVSEGQTLIDMASCERRFVSVELAERDFEKIKPGGKAFVRLIGGNEWKQAQIQQVRGSAARADDRLLAAQVKRPEPNSITVDVALPEDGARSDRNSFCNIGRMAEVRFQRANLAFVDDMWRMLAGFSVNVRQHIASQRVASK
jgi:biotin carboxyl carrier protein